MVQLKAFKYLDENPGEPEQQPQEQQGPISSASSSSSIAVSSGGALTDQDSNPPEVPSNRSQDEMTTLSSNEEYQISTHDIIEEEDEEETEESQQQQAETAIKIVPQLQRKQQDATLQQVNVDCQGKSSPIEPTNFKVPPSPATTTRLIKSASNQLIGSPSQARSGHLSLGGASKILGGQQHGDSVSQCSFVQRQAASNQFEIRWHNVNLFAGNNSSLPKLVTENCIFKYLSGANSRQQEVGRGPESQGENVKFNSRISSPIIGHRLRNESLPEFEKTTKQSAASPSLSSSMDDNCDLGRQILRNVSGSVKSGQLTAILGPSGVGKTTLLNSLTGRNNLEGTGRVLLLGGTQAKRMSVVTVPQADVLPGKLTALEDLQFTSRLKNPSKNFDHQRNIQRIVEHLNMEKFLNTKIDKLSGGEARRLSIGRELLSSPDIMILDEPTSGLDANTCKKIISALRDIVIHSDNILDRPMAIIVTIHQPQQEVLNLFHSIYIMALGGRSIYEGPPTILLPTLLEQSSVNKICPLEQLNENPAIVAIEVASGEYGQLVIDELALHHENQMFEDYANSVSNLNFSLIDQQQGSETPASQRFGPNNGKTYSPFSTPRIPPAARTPKSPISVTPRFGHRPRLRSFGHEQGPGLKTPVLALKVRHQPVPATAAVDHLSTVTSLSFASSYDNELPEVTSHLKVDKRLRRSVVMKSHFFPHTMVLMRRCWLLTTRDLFLMAIRILGFLLVAGGMVQIFSHALDKNEHQCPLYETEIEDLRSFMGQIRSRLMNLSGQLKQASSTHLFFFHLVLCTTMVTSALTGLVFPTQMRMFMREYKNGWYSPASFITSLTFSELPIDMIGPTLTMLIVYPLCNQPSSPYFWREIGYILVMVISSIICKSQAQIVGAFLMESVENSVFISCVMVTPPALLSGIAVRVSQMSWLLQYLSYGSFLRYTFESLFVIRYGYGICPCDPELVFGYPSKTSAEALPPQLDRMVRGFLELNLPPNSTIFDSATAIEVKNSTAMAGVTNEQSPASNLFLRFLHLVTSSGNQFISKEEDLGDCNRYRSLYLIDMGIEDNILFNWFLILVGMFILSRLITYFVIKTVIKLRAKRID